MVYFLSWYSLVSTGTVQLYINRWIHINFCLPNKVHSLHLPIELGIKARVILYFIFIVQTLSPGLMVQYCHCYNCCYKDAIYQQNTTHQCLYTTNSDSQVFWFTINVCLGRKIINRNLSFLLQPESVKKCLSALRQVDF